MGEKSAENSDITEDKKSKTVSASDPRDYKQHHISTLYCITDLINFLQWTKLKTWLNFFPWKVSSIFAHNVNECSYFSLTDIVDCV